MYLLRINYYPICIQCCIVSLKGKYSIVVLFVAHSNLDCRYQTRTALFAFQIRSVRWSNNDLGALIRFGTDGNVFYLRRLNPKTRTSKVLIEISFSLMNVHLLHTRSTTFKQSTTLSPDPHAVSNWSDDQSEENRGDLSAKARSRLHSSNHDHRQQPTKRH